MSYWKTSTCLYAEEKLAETEAIERQCGIFQGISLPPLLFCISLSPLTEQLTKISHLVYTDDSKLVGKTEEEL
jgi:hypothetical protein